MAAAANPRAGGVPAADVVGGGELELEVYSAGRKSSANNHGAGDVSGREMREVRRERGRDAREKNKGKKSS